ncbi:hypothetical protein ACLUW0_02035 [Limosilactobacillus mucosae]
MSNWQNFYTISQQKNILQKANRGIGFPEQLYQLALAAGSSIPKHERIKACRQARMPLLTEDIQNLTAVANHQPIEPRTALKSSQRHYKKRVQVIEKTVVQSSKNSKVLASQRLQTMLKRYDDLADTAETMGIMQFEKHRRYRNRAFEILNDPDAKTTALSRQSSYLEVQIERLEERMQSRGY